MNLHVLSSVKTSKVALRPTLLGIQKKWKYADLIWCIHTGCDSIVDFNDGGHFSLRLVADAELFLSEARFQFKRTNTCSRSQTHSADIDSVPKFGGFRKGEVWPFGVCIKAITELLRSRNFRPNRSKLTQIPKVLVQDQEKIESSAYETGLGCAYKLSYLNLTSHYKTSWWT